MLRCLKKLKVNEGDTLDFYFVENDSTDESWEILWDWSAKGNSCTLVQAHLEEPLYERDLKHKEPFQRLAKLREGLREYAIKQDYDYLLSVDSDILVRPDTYLALQAHGVPFVGASVWNPGGLPFRAINAWDFGPKPVPLTIGDPPRWSYFKYTGSGLTPVGLTGACFLATRDCLERASYLYDFNNNSQSIFQGHKEVFYEDKVFAVSCIDAGIQQYLDQDHRVWHCWKPELLEQFLEFEATHKKRTVQRLADKAWETGLGVGKSIV